MGYQQFDVRLPPELYTRAVETKEPQVWTDDRGYTYEVKLADSGEPFAACVARPGVGDENDAWYRDDPAPEARL